ncbi:PspA/IM30 family protein [Pectobacterium brasiliense]|uniref:PspA/IM30 family protein n=1 Tax=Pectobacterium brasiliense TaxID=180957 RepID=UPI0019D38632|nr:PspA/IM30 family protein [Pectobacterium brasiliense]MBN7764773.1 PspA/IM30 family protein [Pectobacterium brasiliense]
MSLLSKIMTQIKGLLHDSVDKASDDGRTARQLIRDVGENEEKIKGALVEARSQAIIAKQKVEDKQSAIALSKKRAAKAIELDKEDLARTILFEKRQQESDLVVLQNQQAKFDNIVVTLTSRFNDIQKKRSEMERKADSIDLRSKVAVATEEATKLLDVGNFSSYDSASKVFDRLEDNIAKKEARSQARGEFIDAEKDKQDELASLDRHGLDESIEDELAALRAMNKKQE